MLDRQCDYNTDDSLSGWITAGSAAIVQFTADGMVIDEVLLASDEAIICSGVQFRVTAHLPRMQVLECQDGLIILRLRVFD